MFRTSYVHLQEDYSVHAAVYGNATIRYNKTRRHNGCINAWKTYHIRLHVQYGFPADKRKKFETCKGQELN